MSVTRARNATSRSRCGRRHSPAIDPARALHRGQTGPLLPAQHSRPTAGGRPARRARPVHSRPPFLPDADAALRSGARCGSRDLDQLAPTRSTSEPRLRTAWHASGGRGGLPRALSANPVRSGVTDAPAHRPSVGGRRHLKWTAGPRLRVPGHSVRYIHVYYWLMYFQRLNSPPQTPKRAPDRVRTLPASHQAAHAGALH
eukprot:scaffold220_cov430-Prasinococcus_capsulatus_cf.AAC.2